LLPDILIAGRLEGGRECAGFGEAHRPRRLPRVRRLGAGTEMAGEDPEERLEVGVVLERPPAGEGGPGARTQHAPDARQVAPEIREEHRGKVAGRRVE